jgi:hypothetical protein
MSDDPESKLRDYRRAKEVLAGAGWVFDDYVNKQMAMILRTNPEDVEGRERLYRAASTAATLKIGLMREVEEYEETQTLQERREQRMEKTHGGHAVN